MAKKKSRRPSVPLCQSSLLYSFWCSASTGCSLPWPVLPDMCQCTRGTLLQWGLKKLIWIPLNSLLLDLEMILFRKALVDLNWLYGKKETLKEERWRLNLASKMNSAPQLLGAVGLSLCIFLCSNKERVKSIWTMVLIWYWRFKYVKISLSVWRTQ